jgi:sodium/proline symporter
VRLIKPTQSSLNIVDSQTWIALSFIAFVLLFTGVGIYAGVNKQNTTEDYLLASRNANPWSIALSAVATANSGFLFIGLVGYTYQVGVAAIWLALVWVVGDYFTWLWIHRRVREVSGENNAHTVPAFLANNLKKERAITCLSALITLVFLGSYAAAQLQAGGKALYATLGLSPSASIIIGAAIVAIYCFSGGIRASIWTDSVQSVLMMVSLTVLLSAAIATIGGPGELFVQLQTIDPALINPVPSNLEFGFLPFLLGWFAAGFGTVGQPHIIVRAMAINSGENVALARRVYATFYVFFCSAAFGIGLCSRVLLPQLMVAGDTELALPQLAVNLLPSAWVGLMLAGVFSATISTADSQVLSCSAALTQDLFPQAGRSYKWVKLGTLSVAIVVMLFALMAGESVFALVTFAWSGLASSFAPLLIVRALKQPVSVTVAIAMMAIGLATALAWNLVFDLSDAVYEVLPGMLASASVYFVARAIRWQPAKLRIK